MAAQEYQNDVFYTGSKLMKTKSVVIDWKTFPIHNILNMDNSFIPLIDKLRQQTKPFEVFGSLKQYEKGRIGGEVKAIFPDGELIIYSDNTCIFYSENTVNLIKILLPELLKDCESNWS